MDITVICPLYNGEKYIDKLNSNIVRQQLDSGDRLNIVYALTESLDGTENYLRVNNLNYEKIKKEDFSHSLTREEVALKHGKDIIVFISQDISIKNNKWLIELVNPIKNGQCEASFSKQICKYNNIEKYTREFNYSDDERIVSNKDINNLGLYTFFYSDASSAIKGDVYRELEAYDGKKLLINEDMYLAHKIISNGYRIKYSAASEIYHSHDFKLKDLFKRYFDTGVFFETNDQFKKYSGNGNGIRMVKYILKRSVKDRNIAVIMRIIPDFGARFIGSNLGKKHKYLTKKMINKCTLNKAYWKQEKI